MSGLSASLASLMRQRRNWYASLPSAANAAVPGDASAVAIPLAETLDFGSNPGRLRMLSYVPDGLPADAPLVVVLHGCTQDAAGYNHGSGWSRLADEAGFALVFPEQQRANNPNTCFNWFRRGDIARGQGEPLSIQQMIKRMLRNHRLDAGKVFVTGLSAGGAMTSVMLATYPELFAAGAIIGGLPYGVAGNVQEAFASMNGASSHEAEAWGDRVRAASPYKGPRAKVSVWHGIDDPTVRIGNAHELVKQWTNVHGIGEVEPKRVLGPGHERLTWSGPNGGVVELVTIAGMGHGVPVDPSQEGGGETGPYFLDAGLASTRHIAAFWGLIPPGQVDKPRPVAPPRRMTMPLAPDMAQPDPGLQRPGDVNTVIVKALKAAGLLR
ncbi:extracellular catalytic domain type 1 short-chain-length polyhydroxyalkanoate depolymerase [Phreatobacter stygius]|uniref:PHB depolymerase family esterase n=1 Tax=Phreatobacter stygius TaxID=1940610 RepID=A0A4D7B9K3_9HYPH|nr:PHB depolymerase family esterase [Phreatobacter stygius]QCI66858.1 PHB depolymerase family esterase [Phreatobacter stygius]